MSFEAQECADAWNQVHGAISGSATKDQQRIAEVGLCIVAMVLQKNQAYGSSALDPVRIFAKGLSPLDQIHVRLDDKLSRLERGHDLPDESMADTIRDLVGYCVLELIARERAS